MTTRFGPMYIALAVTMGVAVAGALLLGLAPADLWADMPLGKAGLTAEYCELNRMEALVRQPVNAWSNLIYCLLGVWMCVEGIRDWRRSDSGNPLQRFPAMTIWMGLALMGLCFGSFFFHASVTRVGQHWDMAFTYAVAVGLLVGGAYRWGLALGWADAAAGRRGWLLVATALAVLLYFVKWMVDGKILLPAFMLLGVALVLGLYFRQRASFNGWLLLLGIVALLLAGVFRGLDLAKVGCDPTGWLQWHAAWHVCTGLSAFFFWRFLHSEKP